MLYKITFNLELKLLLKSKLEFEFLETPTSQTPLNEIDNQQPRCLPQILLQTFTTSSLTKKVESSERVPHHKIITADAGEPYHVPGTTYIVNAPPLAKANCLSVTSRHA